MLDLLNLPFGWVSVCAVTLLSVLCIAWVINWLIQCYMELVLPRFVDDIKFLQTNYVEHIFNKLFTELTVSSIKRVDGRYIGRITNSVGSVGYIDKEGYSKWTSKEAAAAYGGTYEQIEKLMTDRGYSLTYNTYNYYLIVAPVIIDIVIWLYLLNPFFTTLALLFVGVTYSIRFISTKLYTTMNKTDNHEERINKLEGNE